MYVGGRGVCEHVVLKGFSLFGITINFYVRFSSVSLFDYGC